jgi:hypothetical protein
MITALLAQVFVAISSTLSHRNEDLAAFARDHQGLEERCKVQSSPKCSRV